MTMVSPLFFTCQYHSPNGKTSAEIPLRSIDLRYIFVVDLQKSRMFLLQFYGVLKVDTRSTVEDKKVWHFKPDMRSTAVLKTVSLLFQYHISEQNQKRKKNADKKIK